MRRLLSVVFAVALLGAVAACDQSGDDAQPKPAPSIATSPSADFGANTKTVCDKAKALFAADNLKPIGEQIGVMVQARQSKNKAAETAAMAKIKQLTDALAQKVRDLQGEAADPKVQAGLGKAADGIAQFGSPDYLAKINSIDDMGRMTTDITAAGQDLTAACNA